MMDEVRSTYKLQVIEDAIHLSTTIYRLCNAKLPEQEKFGLWSQMTRCAVSVPSNLAEGQQRGQKEFAQFIRIALGSLKELEVQIRICKEIGYMEQSDCDIVYGLIDKIGAKTYSLYKKVKDND